MYMNKLGEEIFVNATDYSLYKKKKKTYNQIKKIINPFDLNTLRNYPYSEKDKNKVCFLEIEVADERNLIVFKTEKDPQFFEEYFETEVTFDENNNPVYPDLFKEGILNIDLINDKGELVLMYGTSIIILNIDTLDVINFVSSNSINNYGIKLSYENNQYIVKDYKDNIIKFDENLVEIK